MNNTLDIKRFGKVLTHDGLNYFPNLILTLAILWAIPVIVYLFTSLMPTDETNHVFDAFSRISTIGFIKKIAIIIAPARLYKYCNDSRQGIGYAMLPASTLEKFLSMVIFCVIVTPIIYVAGALAIDSILALFNGPYDGFAIAYYFDSFAQFGHSIEKSQMVLSQEESLLLFNSISPTFLCIISLLGTLMLSSIFMLGNMIFKKHKTAKMIGILILLSILFMIISINFVATHELMFKEMAEDGMTEFLKRFLFIIMNTMFYTELIVSALLLWGVYRKIRTQKY
ncbi:MAG: hypothetical protein IKS65_07420 [Bacteroidales bacterium]|nr:hypothetical protein [Bacteroidales bacterium]